MFGKKLKYEVCSKYFHLRTLLTVAGQFVFKVTYFFESLILAESQIVMK